MKQNEQNLKTVDDVENPFEITEEKFFASEFLFAAKKKREMKMMIMTTMMQMRKMIIMMTMKTRRICLRTSPRIKMI